MVRSRASQITVHEFDYRKENQVIYDKNGVTIRSFPAIHTGDGPVSLILEWKGYKIVYGGDTMPNTWMLKYAKNADIVIHEVMPMPQDMVKFYNQPPQLAIRASCGFHTCAPAFGKIMAQLKPRLAVAFHWFNEELPSWLVDGILETEDVIKAYYERQAVGDLYQEQVPKKRKARTRSVIQFVKW